MQAGLEPVCAAAAATLEVIAAVTKAARHWGAPVIATRHAASPAQHRPGILAATGEAAWELISPHDADTVIDAYGVDGFSASPLAEYLAGAGIDHLLVCGLGLKGPSTPPCAAPTTGASNASWSSTPARLSTRPSPMRAYESSKCRAGSSGRWRPAKPS